MSISVQTLNIYYVSQLGIFFKPVNVNVVFPKCKNNFFCYNAKLNSFKFPLNESSKFIKCKLVVTFVQPGNIIKLDHLYKEDN